MELLLILGANSSGKSLYAESIATRYSANPVYIATMVPQNDENLRRIEKHKAQRSGKNFKVLELPVNISAADVKDTDVVLLEDVSNLMANGMFTAGKSAEQTLEDIMALCRKCRMLIAVSISGLCSDEYDGETKQYIDGLNFLNEHLAKNAASVTEMQNSVAVKIK